uniref:Centrosome-associated FAM110 C-terminal domain-containing protein n=2 Tax=Stomoxys calcitrans TaxID=35570 RepID=A0A1I8P8P4_STOCA
MAAVLSSCTSLATTARQLDTNYAQLGEGLGGLAGSCLSLRGGIGVGVGRQSFSKTPHHLNDSVVMYPSLPKYHRSSSAQQTMTTPNQHHSAFSSSLAYGMPVSSGYSSQHSTLQKSYNSSSASVQRANTTSDVCRNYWGHSQPTSSALYRSTDRHQSKRKSAVELLAESKPYFMKSDTPIMERTNFGASTLVCSGKRNRNSSSVILDEGKYNPSYGETTYSAAEAERRYGATTAHRRSSQMHHHHHSHSHNSGCHGSAGNSGLYQGKFRMSMSTDTGHERDKLSRYRKEQFGEPIVLNETKSVSFEEDVAFRIPPPVYFSQQSYGSMYDSGEEPLVLTENYRPISPPAEYAEDSAETHNESRPRYNYQRSYSHSHEMANDKSKYTAASYNINSHKSLPDLHTQINRHSPHSEILSCCSRGNRSIKSAGESSLNRDSGGSSGHYTHRSEPCYRQHRVDLERDREPTKKCCSATTRVEYRRDSGSSTQHSNNSYCDYSCKALMDNYDSSDYLLNFTTPEVPEAFQDDYIPPSPRMHNYQNDDTRYYSSSAHQILGGQGYMKHKASSDEPIVQSPGSQPSIEDISPPPIQFKRQKCIRFKNRNRISLPQQPTSANELSMDSYRRSDPPRYFFPKCFSADDYQPQSQPQSQSTSHLSQPPQSSHQQQIKEFRDQYANNSLRRSQELLHTNPPPPSESIVDLEKFFDRLGLNDDKFHEIYTMSKRKHSNGSDSDNSTVFFSDVSTVDSMRLPDSTETQPQTTQTYRPTEPPSIVERNARIIKWLCNVRKVQNDLN